jgi:signal transduction histidine kinase
MQPAALPSDEPDRLAALYGLGILDTPPEERFDRITRLARRVFGTPIALVSLVDRNRQWFKSCLGLNATSTARDVSFCSHAVIARQPLVVLDPLADPRFRDNPLVLGEPHIRFYAGVPLYAAGGQPVGTLCVIDREPRPFDATDLEALSDLAAVVERELNHVEVAVDLGRRTAQAEQASSNKSSFLAHMSHELRTPLNAIIGYSEMLGEEAQELELPNFVQDLDRINASGKHLLELIDQVLDMSKIEAGRMEVLLEVVDLPALLAELAAIAAPLVARKANRLALDLAGAPDELRTDAMKLRQMLLNLLSNAAKFTEAGTITLRVAQEGQAVSFQVADTGIGMDENQVARLFGEYMQAEAGTSRRYGGTGLGLAISKKLAELLGGDLKVESAPARGSTFTLRLPHPAPEVVRG